MTTRNRVYDPRQNYITIVANATIAGLVTELPSGLPKLFQSGFPKEDDVVTIERKEPKTTIEIGLMGGRRDSITNRSYDDSGSIKIKLMANSIERVAMEGILSNSRSESNLTTYSITYIDSNNGIKKVLSNCSIGAIPNLTIGSKQGSMEWMFEFTDITEISLQEIAEDVLNGLISLGLLL